eukprot:TRINITY_DN5410_c0_g4_i1.p1 TRINITY_DN5410_c0_g4~~TRINITY_DN5410_c0_g4_i1.p1  ORF type:complete len:874 (+),score=238.83 TRINITY_DN5410_c0_g4_i1:123-2744(+)
MLASDRQWTLKTEERQGSVRTAVEGSSRQPTIVESCATAQTVPVHEDPDQLDMSGSRCRGGTVFDPLAADLSFSPGGLSALEVDCSATDAPGDGAGPPLSALEWKSLQMSSSRRDSSTAGFGDCYDLLVMRLRDGGAPQFRGALQSAASRLTTHGLPPGRRAELWPQLLGAAAWKSRFDKTLWRQLESCSPKGDPAERIARCAAILQVGEKDENPRAHPGTVAAARLLLNAGMEQESCFWSLCALAHDQRWDLGSVWHPSAGGLSRRSGEFCEMVERRQSVVHEWVQAAGATYEELLAPFATGLLSQHLRAAEAARFFDAFAYMGWLALHAVLLETFGRAVHQLKAKPAKSPKAAEALSKLAGSLLGSEGSSIIVAAWCSQLRPLTPPRSRTGDAPGRASPVTPPGLRLEGLRRMEAGSRVSLEREEAADRSPRGGWLAGVRQASASGGLGSSRSLRPGGSAAAAVASATDVDDVLDELCRITLRWAPAVGEDADPHATRVDHIGDATIWTHAAAAFRDLREQKLGLPQPVWDAAWANKLQLKVMSSGRSGSAFYPSHCGRFLLKTLTREELQQAADLLPSLLRRFYSEPPSLLCPLVSLFSIERSVTAASASGRSGSVAPPRYVAFAVYPTAFPPQGSTPPRIAFDLKGSTHKRKARQSDLARVPPLLKDLDFLGWLGGGAVRFRPADARALRARIAADAAFLREEGLMDYSLLMGIGPAPSDSMHAPFCESVQLCGQDICYLTVIDYLQAFTLRKRMAAKLKGLKADPSTLSTVPPQLYAARFERFLADNLFRTAQAEDAALSLSTTSSTLTLPVGREHSRLSSSTAGLRSVASATTTTTSPVNSTASQAAVPWDPQNPQTTPTKEDAKKE